jgi:Winged helix-turn helix
MPKEWPYKILLSSEEKRELTARAAKYSLPYFQVQRSKMILLAAQGLDSNEIARRLDTRRKVVWLWCKRFYEKRLQGLDELPRPGRPRAFPPRDRSSGKGSGV